VALKDVRKGPISIGVIGGGALAAQWGLASQSLACDTPYGETSSAISRIVVNEHATVYAILRHGEGHSRGAAINNRANVEALHRLGCEVVLSLSLAGALTDRYDIGMTVVYDDVIDFRRSFQSFFELGQACHVPMAPMVCPPLASQLDRIASENELLYGGTMVVIEGPRFSTRAESKMYASVGGDLICQTIAPECFLVRERRMCWAGVCLVTDRDTHDPSRPVSTPLIYENMERYRARYAADLFHLISGLRPFTCSCRVAFHEVPRHLTEDLSGVRSRNTAQEDEQWSSS
jgi:5'-methylthioadenosine phosphorylase